MPGTVRACALSRAALALSHDDDLVRRRARALSHDDDLVRRRARALSHDRRRARALASARSPEARSEAEYADADGGYPRAGTPGKETSMERDPDATPGAGDEDLLGDPDDVEHSVEERLDEQLEAEKDDED
jgi:hypothetical protein